MRFHILVLRGSVIVWTCAAVFGIAHAAGPDAATGAQISAQCAACHGADGMSVDTIIPNLAGQHYQYLLAQMNAFKQRTRSSPLMNELMRPMTEEQIKDVAAYYAGVQIQVKAVPKGRH